MTTTEKKIHGHGEFIHGSVRVVDYNSYFNNILVRGSSAFGAKTETGDAFTMADLISAITSDVNFASTGIKLSANPLVIDFCLIGFGSEKDEKIVKSEIDWFAADSTLPSGNEGPYPTYYSASNSGVTSGSTVVYWPIQALGTPLLTTVGATWNPSPANSIGPGTSNEGFNYSALVPAIWNALNNQTANLPSGTGVPTSITNAIIYVHCDSGVNRTGAAVTGYLLNFGSNLAALDQPSSNGVPTTLAKAQAAAERAAPSNDSPPGGVDIPVTQAFCNYIYTKQLDGSLIAACLPAGS